MRLYFGRIEHNRLLALWGSAKKYQAKDILKSTDVLESLSYRTQPWHRLKKSRSSSLNRPNAHQSTALCYWQMQHKTSYTENFSWRGRTSKLQCTAL